MTRGADDQPRPPGLEEAPHYKGHRERLRLRFAETGDQGLPDYEILELLLFRSIAQRDVKPIAKELIAEIDEVKTSGDDAFTIAKKAIVKDASKQAIADFINRIKSYGNQRLD